MFDALVQDLRAVSRLAQGRTAEPSAAIFDSRTLQSPPKSGTRAGYDGAKRRRGSQVHLAVNTLGTPLALYVTAANVQDRSQVCPLAGQVQAVTGDAVAMAYVDQGYTGAQAAQDAEAHHLHLQVVKLPEAQKGFVLVPHRWVIERILAWAGRFRRLARDYAQLAETLAGLHCVAFAIVMLKHFVKLMI